MLEPTTEECEMPFWISLQSEPSEESFAFTYDHAHSKKKQEKDANDEEEIGEDAGVGQELTNAQIELVANAAAEKVLGQLKSILDEYHDKLDEYHEKLVDNVAERVTTKLLDRAPHQDDMEHDDVNNHIDDNWGVVGQIVEEYAEVEKGASIGEDGEHTEPLAHDQSPPHAKVLPAKAAASSPPHSAEPITPAAHIGGQEKVLKVQTLESEALEEVNRKETTSEAQVDGQV